jgi:hypothetical protein
MGFGLLPVECRQSAVGKSGEHSIFFAFERVLHQIADFQR